jgi:serine/threonine protein kinase
MGAFGQVWKARNKLDSVEYAIKKVKLKNAKTLGIQKILREVKYLAKLNHPNVVRYFASWIEYSRWSPFPSSEEFTINDSLTYSTTSVEETSLCLERSSSQESLQNLSPEWMLFIQMELCGQTLAEYLQNRSSVDISLTEIQSIFMDLVLGLEYIHSQGCIHRDLKPQNIYHQSSSSRNVWKIGDFGLATSTERESTFVAEQQKDTFSYKHSLGIGTLTYASPEKLSNSRESNYTTQSDMYSLGMILFELMHPFTTYMERARVLSELRQCILPETFVKHYPQESTLILWLMSHDPLSRPTASEIIQFENLRSSSSSTLLENKKSNRSSSSRSQILNQSLEKENKLLQARIVQLENLLKSAGIEPPPISSSTVNSVTESTNPQETL